MSDILNKKGIRALPKGCGCGCSYCVKCTGVGRDRRNRKTERHRTQQEYLRERLYHGGWKSVTPHTTWSEAEIPLFKATLLPPGVKRI